MRHPLPYAYAKAHTLLLEDDGARMVLWAPALARIPGARHPAALALALVYHVIGFVPVSVAGLAALAVGGHRVALQAPAELAPGGALATG